MLASPFKAVETTLTNSKGYNLTPRLTTQLIQSTTFFCREGLFFFLNQQPITLQVDWPMSV